MATDAERLVDTVKAIEEVRSAGVDLRAIIDRLATVLYAVEVEDLRRWIVPPMHRPTCPVDGQPCTSWTCLVDVCVDVKKPDSGRTVRVPT